MLRKLVVLTVMAVTMAGTSTAQARDKRVYTGDWMTATKIVGKYYGHNVERWLVNCSSSEGGHGLFVWRSHTRPAHYGNGKYEDKPGGWMQFFSSTFYSNVSWTFKDAKHRGLRAHPKARSYYEPLGQAIVAGAMYFYRGSGPWTGVYC